MQADYIASKEHILHIYMLHLHESCNILQHHKIHYILRSDFILSYVRTYGHTNTQSSHP
jgi:hypothetical protein